MEGFKQKIEEILDQEEFSNLGLKFAGIGSDKVVFETIGSERKLIKISRNALRARIAGLLNDDTDERFSEDNIIEKQKGSIKEEKEREQEALDIFGSEHFLRRGIFKIKIPITKDFLYIFVDKSMKSKIDDLPDDFYKEVKIVAETQLIAEELKNPEKFNPISFNTSLITSDNFDASENIDEAFYKSREIVNKNFFKHIEKYINNETYRPILEEIVSKIIEYTKKTGMMVDIFGPNNITIFKKEDGSVDYHILEILMPGSQKTWMENITSDPKLRHLRHYYVYYYSIKTIADKLGLIKNLEPEDLNYFKGVGIPEGDFPAKENM